MSLCQYADIFGKPGEGVHRHRIFGIAAVDLIMTVGAAALIGYFVPSVGFLAAFVILMVLATALHKLFCVDTALIKAIGL